MNDEELVQTWTTLTPSMPARRRIDDRVGEWLEARDRSIAAEWLGLLKVEPFAAIALTVVGAAAILAAMPLTWLVRALM
jgi:hypothetical protein